MLHHICGDDAAVPGFDKVDMILNHNATWRLNVNYDVKHQLFVVFELSFWKTTTLLHQPYLFILFFWRRYCHEYLYNCLQAETQLKYEVNIKICKIFLLLIGKFLQRQETFRTLIE